MNTCCNCYVFNGASCYINMVDFSMINHDLFYYTFITYHLSLLLFDILWQCCILWSPQFKSGIISVSKIKCLLFSPKLQKLPVVIQGYKHHVIHISVICVLIFVLLHCQLFITEIIKCYKQIKRVIPNVKFEGYNIIFVVVI